MARYTGSAVIVTDLTKEYGSFRALNGISLSIGTGTFGLLGPNGAGKSTFMKILATLLKPNSGRAEVMGCDITSQGQAVRAILGYLPQEFGFHKRLTGREMLEYIAYLKGMPAGKSTRNAIGKLLELVNLDGAAHKPTGSYSGGMRQRLGIAQALLGEPRLLIIDEPTAGLDPEERIRFRNLLAQVGRDRIVILSTHIVGDIEAVCGRMAVLKSGRVAYEGPPTGLIDKASGKVWQLDVSVDEAAAISQAFPVLGSRQTADIATMRVIAESRPVLNAQLCTPTLEDGYMALMGGESCGAA